MNTTQTINAGVQTAMSAALHSANIENIVKAGEAKSTDQLDSPALVCRVDLLGAKIVFLANSQDRTAGTIKFWGGKKGDKTLVTAPIDFYKSTRVIENEESVKKLVQDFSTTFGHKTVILRQRLVKSSVLDRDEGGNTNSVNVDEYKQKLIAAITKAILDS